MPDTLMIKSRIDECFSDQSPSLNQSPLNCIHLTEQITQQKSFNNFDHIWEKPKENFKTMKLQRKAILREREAQMVCLLLHPI